ncbi:histone deacetylase 10 [Cricetulus griseus]
MDQSDHGVAMGTALVYHEDMTATRLLWDDPECEIECPERLTAALDGLRQRGLEQRCLCLSACEASEEELGLVHRGRPATWDKQVGQQAKLHSGPQSTFHCARLAVGAALQLVDAVLTGAVHNGLALVRPPGHHSQKAAANGFCVFNNVAIAAKHAKQKYGLQRILIVDWDIHHGQGIQYIFDDDPSVLYFSWHRYEHGRFWPFLQESDACAVGQGQGQGFTVNLPWNQFDPELVLVSAGFDSAIGDPETTGGFLSCILGLVLPLAYGFQPDMVLMALGPAHGLQNAQAALLAAVLRGPAGGRILAIVEERRESQFSGFGFTGQLWDAGIWSANLSRPGRPEDKRRAAAENREDAACGLLHRET